MGNKWKTFHTVPEDFFYIWHSRFDSVRSEEDTIINKVNLTFSGPVCGMDIMYERGCVWQRWRGLRCQFHLSLRENYFSTELWDSKQSRTKTIDQGTGSRKYVRITVSPYGPPVDGHSCHQWHLTTDPLYCTPGRLSTSGSFSTPWWPRVFTTDFFVIYFVFWMKFTHRLRIMVNIIRNPIHPYPTFPPNVTPNRPLDGNIFPEWEMWKR